MEQHKKSRIRMGRVGIQVVASRPDFLSALLVSLKNQTYKLWDLILVVEDENIIRRRLVYPLLERLQLEGHRVKILVTKMGLCAMRNLALDNDDCEFGLRIDDDSVCEQDYIEKLVSKMGKDIGAVGGIVPTPETYILMKPKPKYNVVDKDGNITDDCIYIFNTVETFDVDHVRSSMMYYNEVARRIRFPTYNDEFASFREETDFCIRLKLAGYRIVFVPQAICWHMLAERGGCRNNMENAYKDADKRFREKIKEYGWQAGKGIKNPKKGKKNARGARCESIYDSTQPMEQGYFRTF